MNVEEMGMLAGNAGIRIRKKGPARVLSSTRRPGMYL